MSTRDVGNLRTKLSWEDDGANRSLEGFKRDLKGLRSEMRYARSGGREYTQSLKGMRDQSDILTRRLGTQREQVQELRRRYEESARTKGEDNKQTQNLANEYRNATAQMNMTEDQLKRLNDEIRRQESPWTQLGEKLTDAGDKMQKFGTGMSRVGRGMTMRVTTPIVAMGTAALMAGMNFEEGMSKVQAISGATGEEMQNLEDLAKELGATTRFSATEAAGGMEYLAMAGFETNQILESMPGLLDLAASSNMDLSRAADIASNIISGFGYEAEDAGRVADVLAKGASSANTDVAQLGDAMATVAPIASALGLDVEGLTAAVGFMSDAGIQGSTAGRQLRQGLLRLADPTGAAATLIEDLGINVFDADGNMKELDQVVHELSGGLEGMSSQAQTAALSTLFGSQSVAGWTALLERGGDELGDYTAELENSEGAASDMAATMQDNAKGAMTEFKSALEGVGIAISEHIIPTFTNIVDKGTEIVRKFGELDEEQQQQIIKWAGIAAAAGPALMIMGNMLTVVGGVARVAGTLATTIGAAGGAGLAGRVGLLGMSGPAGLAVAGVGALATGAYILYRNLNDLHDISTETADAMMDQYQSNLPLIDSFDELRKSSLLTNDEFGRYLDLQSKLESESNPDAIEEIKNEMEELRDKSGLSNKELENMIGYNNDIVEALPEATSEITEQGNRIADTTDKLYEYNQEIANMARRELEAELQKSLANEQKIREQINVEQVELNRLIHAETGLQELVKAMHKGSAEAQKEKLIAEREVVEQAIEEAHLRGEVSQELFDQRDNLDTLIALSEEDLVLARETLGTTIDAVEEQRNLITEKEADLDKTGEIVAKMAEYELIAAGIDEQTAQKAVKDAEVSTLLTDQLQSLKDQKNEMFEQTEPAQRVNDAFKENVRDIDKQISGLETAKGNLGDLIADAGEYNTELSKDIEKMILPTASPSLESFNREWGRSISRTVNLNPQVSRGYIPIPTYASGTDYHPRTGPALVGEEGPELARMGNRWSMLDFGIANLQRGTQVFTHDESKKILRSLNNMPAYATGTNMGGETNRIVSSLNGEPAESTKTVSLLTRIAVAIESGQSVQIEGREVMRATINHFDEGMNNIGDRRNAAWGG